MYDIKTSSEPTPFSGTPVLIKQRYSANLSAKSNAARKIKPFEVNRCSNDCRTVEVRLMHPRTAQNPACSSQVCFSRVLHDLRLMTNASSLDAILIRLVLLWLGHTLADLFLKRGTTIGSLLDTITVSKYQAVREQNLKYLDQLNSTLFKWIQRKTNAARQFMMSYGLDLLSDRRFRRWICCNGPRQTYRNRYG